MQKEKKNKTINKDMLIKDVIEEFGEEGIKIMFDYGIHCAGCPAAAFESLEQGTKAHGLPIEPLIKSLRKLADQ